MNLKLNMYAFSLAAVKIQKVIRGVLARKHLRESLIDEADSALTAAPLTASAITLLKESIRHSSN